MRPLLLILSVIQNAKTRAFARMVLEGAGHRVIEAAGSSQATALLINGLDPDLLLCEAAAVNSSETSQFRQYLKFAPAEKICLITRLSDQRILAEAAELGIKLTLTMPLMREDIELAVESLTLAGRQVRAVRNTSPDFSEIAISAANLAHLPHIPRTSLTICPPFHIWKIWMAAISFWLRRRKCWKSIARSSCLRISMSMC